MSLQESAAESLYNGLSSQLETKFSEQTLFRERAIKAGASSMVLGAFNDIVGHCYGATAELREFLVRQAALEDRRIYHALREFDETYLEPTPYQRGEAFSAIFDINPLLSSMFGAAIKIMFQGNQYENPVPEWNEVDQLLDVMYPPSQE